MRHTKLFILIVIAMFTLPLWASGNGEAGPVVSENSNHVQFGENWWVEWRFVGDEIEFTMAAPTTGWVAIGFNPSRMMRDADFVIAYVKDTMVYARDDYGTSNTGHGADVSLGGVDNVRIISGKEEGQVTTITFAGPTNSGDTYDAVFVPGQTYKILVAHGADGQDNFTSMHRGRSSANVVLK